jgi:hypothetical protein
METQELIIIEVFCQEYQIEINFIHDLEPIGYHRKNYSITQRFKCQQRRYRYYF